MRSRPPELLALEDQLWATIAEHQDDVARIANNGPRFGDEALCRFIACAAMGELCARQGELELGGP